MRSVENPLLFIFLLIGFVFISKTSGAQVDEYDILKSHYERLSHEQKLDSALFAAKQMNHWASQNEGDTSLRYAESYRFIGNCYSEIQLYDSAFYYWNKSKYALKKQNRYFSIDYARALYNIGNYYLENIEYKLAQENLEQALKIVENCCANEKEYLAKCYNSMGYLSWKISNYDSAEKHYQEALSILQKEFSENRANIASIMNNLGVLYSDMGDFVKAKFYYLQSIQNRKLVYSENHPEYASSLNNIGSFYYEMGDWKSAENYFEEAADLYKQLFGDMDPDYAMSIYNLGILYLMTGDYRNAERFCKQAYEIRKRCFGIEHPTFAESSGALGKLYLIMGEYNKAEIYCKDALNIIKNTLGEQNPKFAENLATLGECYLSMGNYKTAEAELLRSSMIMKNVLGKDHPKYISSLILLGDFYFELEDFKISESYYNRASHILKKVFSKQNYFYATSLFNLGISHYAQGNFKKAKEIYFKSLRIYNDLYGDSNSIGIEIIIGLGYLDYEQEDYKSAFDNFNFAYRQKAQQLADNFIWRSAREKEIFFGFERYFFDFLITFSVKAEEKVNSSKELSYNSILLLKSLLLETSRELDQVIYSSNNEELKSQLNEMKQLRRLYSKMQSEGSDKKELMDRYKAQADSLDKILVNRLGEYASAKRKFEITWKDVQFGLYPNDAAIEFASYNDENDSVQKYFALVVRPGYEYPKLVKIGKEPEIKEAIKMKDFSTLYNLVWQGLDSLLEGVDRVYYSPDGELNNVSFSGLYHRENGSDSISYLIDRYELHQLTTTRYLADGTLKKQQPFEASAALLGGIDYNQIPTVDFISKGEESNEDNLLQLNLDKEIQQNRSSSFSSKMPSLKGTEIEVKTISGLLNHSGWNTTSYTGQSAGENQIKYDLLQKSPGVLHIATHGFAFPDIVKKETDLIQMNDKSSYKASEDPMVRCGLMLSGSNISWAGDPKKMIEQTGDDGILTAAEVANMDLSNTKLVVLSACETGLGKIEGSEGTFGLKRAFKLAGVEQLIVSLRSVPDKETMELMTLFYTDLSLTKDPVVSFQKAQREMRYRYPNEPEKWAGFVLVR